MYSVKADCQDSIIRRDIQASKAVFSDGFEAGNESFITVESRSKVRYAYDGRESAFYIGRMLTLLFFYTASRFIFQTV